MLDAFFNLSWQFKVLVLEVPTSVLIGVWLLQRGYQCGPGSITFGLTWNAVAVTLFLTGGAHVSWQHVLYLGTFVADSLSVVLRGLRRERREAQEVGFLGACFLTLAMFCIIALLVTG